MLLRRTGPLSARELQQRLGLQPRTFARLAQRAPEVVRYGRTRRLRYAASRTVEGVGSTLPLLEVQGAGTVVKAGTVYLLAGGGAAVEWEGGGVTEHGSVPWFLEDARPQGFLGRNFLRARPELALPPLTHWRPDDTIRVLALWGDDLPGSFLLGDAACQGFHLTFTPAALRARAIPEQQRVARFGELAEAVMHGESPGSSAAGEQPKFTCVVSEGDQLRHVLVKFSPPLATEAGRRWADLLVCEHLALETLRAHGTRASSTRVLEGEDRLFLEVTRFDRVGALGRRRVASLAMVDAEFVGAGNLHWARTAEALVGRRQLSASDGRDVCRLEAFGRLILNTDRHAGNVSLFWREGDALELAPIYDMLPMGFAPEAGQLMERALPRPVPDSVLLDVWEEMKQVARGFWERVGASALVSPGFKDGPLRQGLALLGLSG